MNTLAPYIAANQPTVFFNKKPPKTALLTLCKFSLQRASNAASVSMSCVIMSIDVMFRGECVSFPPYPVHGANMGPNWVLSAPDGPHVGPMNLAIRVDTVERQPSWSRIQCVKHRQMLVYVNYVNTAVVVEYISRLPYIHTMCVMMI